ncbi:hypothetical protein MNZ22_04680 [Aeromonas encheleia]|uniref:hypothetical protein n=1 Tax=Aeromonas TaxID=642 RepID=UPI001C493CD0|nr:MULTISPECIES: hypothetical protein [Aeromonas]MBV7598805.1 hypothetical protein [Aeromonas sp. sia0103]UNP89670.1 hypothetical protein MNZ22_04680 [Aeromonas encheleia]
MQSNAGAVLICPDFFDYKKLLTAELEHRYKTVLAFSDRPLCSSVSKALIKFNILGYAHVASKRYSSEIFKVISGRLPSVEEVIIVKGTCISPCLIESIKKLNPKTRVTCYSWDSISNIKTFPLLAEKADLAYTFDIADSKRYGYGYLPLFYSDKKNHGATTDKKYKYSFIGSYHGDRVSVLQHIFSHEDNANNYVRIFFPSKLQFAFYYLLDSCLRAAPREWITFKPLSRAEIISVAEHSEYIIDIHNANQTGLTMRTWETLGDGHKLVTTNAAVLCHAAMSDVIIIDRNTGKRWSETQCSVYFNEMSYSALSVDSLSLSTWLDNLLARSEN